jgi:hypothetical protein
VRGKTEGVEESEDEQQDTPPDVGVKMVEHDWILRRMRELVEARSKNQYTVHQQRDADKEPDGDGTLRIHAITRK